MNTLSELIKDEIETLKQGRKGNDMKLMKRTGIYSASNVTFNPETMLAKSYDWWSFVVDSLLIFSLLMFLRG